MRVSIISVFLLTFSLFVGGIIYRVDNLMFSDRVSWTEASARAQLSPTLQAIEFELNGLALNLALSLPNMTSPRNDFSRSSSLASFGGLLAAASLATADYHSWNFEKILFAENSDVRPWAENYIKLLLTNTDARNMKPGQIMIFSLLDPKGKPFIWILEQLNRDLAAQSRINFVGALLGPEYFQKVVDHNRGQLNEIFFVNSLGYTLAHSIPEYMGKLLNEHPIVAEITKNQLASGSGIFDDLRGQRVQGIYEQVPNSNLYIVISTTTSDLFKNRSDIRLQLLFLGLGLASLGVAIFALLYRGSDRESDRSNSSIEKTAAPATAVTVTPSLPEDGNRERMATMVQVASALAHKLSGPIAGILGAVKLLKHQPGALEQLDTIEDHARKTREVLRTLLTFSGEAVPKFEIESLTDLMEKNLKALEPKFFRKGIMVKKDFDTLPKFEMPAGLLSKAFDALLNNAIESMERRPKKDLRVSIRALNGSVDIQIQDSGEGIENSNIEKIFDPFFTTKKNQSGLGLTLAAGIIRELSGNIFVSSDKASGTTVRVLLNPEMCAFSVQQNKNVDAGFTKPSSQSSSSRTPEFSAVELSTTPPPEALPPSPAEASELLQLENPEVDSVLEGTYESQNEATAVMEVKIPEEKRVSNELGPFTAKIDSPDFKIQKNASKIDQIGFSIRKPGARP